MGSRRVGHDWNDLAAAASDREFKITSINRIKALTEKLQCGEQVSNFSRVIVDTQNNQVEILELKNKW